MMQLTAAVQEQIRRFVVDQIGADELSDWLSAHAQDILDSGQTEARRLMDRAFSLLEDEIQGRRSEDDVRALLVQEIPASVTVTDLAMAELTGCTAGTITLHASWTPLDNRAGLSSPSLTASNYSWSESGRPGAVRS